MNYLCNGMYFNRDAYNKVKELNKQIEQEASSENPDLNKINELKMSRLYKGMLLSNINFNNRAYYPY